MDLSINLKGLWRSLVVVDREYSSVGARRRVELLRSLIIPFFVFSLIGIYFSHGIVQQGLMLSLLFQAGSYLLSRTRYLSLAAMFAVLAACVPQYYPAMVVSEISAIKLGDLILWMWIPLILSSLWLRPSHYALFAILHLSLVACAPVFLADIVWSDIYKLFTISLIGATMLWGATLIRNRELCIIDEESKMLRERKNMLATIQDNIQEMIAVFTEDGRLRTANQALKKMYNIMAADLEKGVFLGDIIDLSQNNTLSETDILRDHYARKMKSTFCSGGNIPLEVKFSATEIHGVPHYVGVLRDIRQQNAYENVLKKEKEMAQRESKAKSEFISSVSHELRTPLNAVLGFAQLMEFDNQDLETRHVNSVKEIRRAGEHLLELINEILDLAAIEAGKFKLSMGEVALQDLFDECGMLCASIANEKQVSIKIQNADRLAVFADPLRLKQVLLNLISNAIKYNRNGGSVLVYCENRSNGVIRINIRDTGYGMNVEEIERLFQPFERMEKNSNIEGVGIGLVISKKLIEHMGGRIGLYSEEQQGSTFWVELDVVQARSEPSLSLHG